MRFKLSADAKKYLSGQNNETVKRIYKHLRDATKNPPKGDIVPMAGNTGRYRLRVGGYRILLTILDDVMIVAKISPRGDVYKG